MNDKRREQLIDEWAVRLRSSGLGPIAPLLIGTLHPLGFIGSQVMLVGQPVLSLFTDERLLQELVALLDDPDALDAIERRLNGAGDHPS